MIKKEAAEELLKFVIEMADALAIIEERELYDDTPYLDIRDDEREYGEYLQEQRSALEALRLLHKLHTEQGLDVVKVEPLFDILKR